jgi:hypothetical protein
MLLLSIIVIACAFLPPIFLAYQLSEKLAWQASCGIFAVLWCWYWVNALITLKTRFPVWGSLSLGNKINTAVIHPASFVSLFAGMIGLWGQLIAPFYLTALFVMLCMSAYLFLQIILELLDSKTDT